MGTEQLCTMPFNSIKSGFNINLLVKRVSLFPELLAFCPFSDKLIRCLKVMYYL